MGFRLAADSLLRKRQRKRLLNAFLLQDWALALAVLNQLAAGDCTYNTLDISIYDRSIGACRSAGNWQLANFFLISMRRQRTFPDAVCFSNAMSTCSKELQWHGATAMLQQMFIQAVVPDLVCLGAVLGTLQSAADLPVWTNALAILQQHPATSGSNICCNACISSCVQWAMALDLLHGMAAAAVQRDGISISTTIASAEDRRRLGPGVGMADTDFILWECRSSRFSPPHPFDSNLGVSRNGGMELAGFAALHYG